MEERLKSRIILILTLLTLIFLLGTVHSCGTAKKLKMTSVELDKQKGVSWDAEQKMNELKKDKATLEKELQDTKTENEAVKKSLMQEQLVSQSLKDELQKVTKLKEELEAQLKKAPAEKPKSSR